MKIRTPHIDVATGVFPTLCLSCGVDATWRVKVTSPHYALDSYYCGDHVPAAALDQYLVDLAP